MSSITQQKIKRAHIRIIFGVDGHSFLHWLEFKGKLQGSTIG